MQDDILNPLSRLFAEFLRSPKFKALQQQHMAASTLSDMNRKVVVHLANSKRPLSAHDVALLASIMGKGDGRLDPFDDDEDWTEDMVNEYADNLKNYLYTYKESAQDIDPSIDPSEPHRGPMAQDIEKVAPDCVRETADGTKVVNGNRLALVNAGVIGELSRRLLALENAVYGGGSVNVGDITDLSRSMLGVEDGVNGR